MKVSIKLNEKKMTLEKLLEALAEDPFDNEMRSKLAVFYYENGEHEKVLKQLKLISKKQELDSELIEIKVSSLGALGFDDEANMLQKNISEESKITVLPNANISKSELKIVTSGSEKIADVVALKSPNKDVVRFCDIGGHKEAKKALRLQIIEPYKNPDLYKKFKKSAGGGVLLYGAPGCGKTMLAKATAYECGAEFIPVRISDILSRWMGESEINLAGLFEKARANKPSLMFFDELDALAFARNKSNSQTYDIICFICALKFFAYIIAGFGGLAFYLTKNPFVVFYVIGFMLYWLFLYAKNSIFSLRTYTYRPKKR